MVRTHIEREGMNKVSVRAMVYVFEQKYRSVRVGTTCAQFIAGWLMLWRFVFKLTFESVLESPFETIPCITANAWRVHCMQHGNTALHEAACANHSDMVSLLLEHKANPNLKNSVRDACGCGTCAGTI